MSRLLAVMVVDMVESTELLDQHGTAAAIASRRLVDKRIGDACQGSSGQIVDTNGDGTTLVFDSSGEALSAAAALQLEPVLNLTSSRPSTTLLRVGVSVGEVDLDGRSSGRVLAEAELLCQECEPGSVAVSPIARQLRAL